MPARLERRIASLVVSATAGQVAAGGWFPLTETAVPSNKKWNVNLIFQSTDGAATRNARLAIAGGKPAHGLNALAIGPVVNNQLFTVSPAGTYLAVIFGAGNRLELYKRIGTVGLVYVDMLVDAGGSFSNIAFSPDERWLGWTSVGFSNVFATAVSSLGFGATTNSAATAAVAQSGASSGDAIAWSPSGAYIAVTTTVAAAAGRLSVFPFAAGVFGGRIDAPGMTAAENIWQGPPAWAPDETVLAIVYGQGGTAPYLHGWPFAAGVFGAVNKLQYGVAGLVNGLAWSPDAAVKLIALPVRNDGAVTGASTSHWTGAAWTAQSNLTVPIGNLTSRGIRWLGPRLVQCYGSTGASVVSSVIDLVGSDGVLVANLQSLGAGLLTMIGGAPGCRQFFVNDQLFRWNAGATQIVVETMLSSAITLLPTIGIVANGRVVLAGIVLEAGDRLLVGTPAATDVYSVVGSAIEIG